MVSINMLGLNLWKIEKVRLKAFFEIANECSYKLIEIWVDQRKKLYNGFMHKWLDSDNTLMYYTNNERKSRVSQNWSRGMSVINFVLKTNLLEV